MSDISITGSSKNKIKHNFFKDYDWFYENFYKLIQDSVCSFFEKDVELRFMGISGKENIFFYGDEYYRNKIPVNNNGKFIVKISTGVVSYFLDIALGKSSNKFQLQTMSDIEDNLIKSLTVFLYKKLSKNLKLSEPSRKELIESENYNFTFFVKTEQEHKGKIIITLPSYILPVIEEEEKEKPLSTDDLLTANAIVNIGVGKSKISLKDLKNIESGDLIILENSDINKMFVIHNKNYVNFLIEPNPALIINIDDDGDNSMSDETNLNVANMWDTILVDVIAEFDNIKMSLGDLKQISEGLVIDVGSVYENKINLKVENQVVASGELVIVNDRYGVRIDSVKQKSNEQVQPQIQTTNETDLDVNDTENEIQEENNADNTENDDSFDYGDFEIEDENI